MGIRNLFYDLGLFKSHVIQNVKIIAVGNISTGGTGKTPLVQYIAQFLHTQNKKVAILSRGYKRTTKGYILGKDYEKVYHVGTQIGDEPTQYVHNLPFAAVAVSEKRVIGANELVRTVSPEIILLDDAFQHRAIERNLNIVVLDYHSPPWQDFLLPMGNLREPMISLERADIVVINKVKYQPQTQRKLSQFERYIHAIKPNLPIFICSYQPQYLVKIADGNIVPLEELQNKCVFAVCGIGNPDYFIAQLEELKAEIPTVLTLKDHRNFDASVIKCIQDEIALLNPDYVVCTEKDFYRMRYTPAYQVLKEIPNFCFLKIELVFWDQDEEKFKTAIMEKLFSSPS